MAKEISDRDMTKDEEMKKKTKELKKAKKNAAIAAKYQNN